jgi:hypothetical protein
MDETDKRRIAALVVKMVEGKIERGELDPNDDAAIRAAAKEFAPIARSAYFAALEYISG